MRPTPPAAPSTDAALQYFHPLVATWFASRYRAPTDAQRRAWPVIAADQHALITAPTGSGKTLTAFLWALDRLITGHYALGQTRVLYVSPLKALNTDIRRNLETPLAELKALFEQQGVAFPNIRVRTRSGDTTASERAAMLRKPPEILITTPESLNLLLTSVSGRNALASVRAVILDEIHDLVPTRRGVQLITAVERLAASAGEFQRIALSATVRPIEAVAHWVAGYQLLPGSALTRPALRQQVHYRARPITLVQSTDTKALELSVELPVDAVAAMNAGEKIWVPIAAELRATAARNRATLVFTNSRRLAEKITLEINGNRDPPIAFAHHGSLSRDIRLAVEQRLKDGQLKAIVATSSLEMGIDIGELDEVVMLQSPPTITATIQRTGRAGHQVGAVSHGRLMPSHGHDFLEAAALIAAVAERDIEPVDAINGALDILAQQLISMTAQQSWDIDLLFATVRCAAPYHALPREQFDLVLDMLAGRYANTRIRALNTRLAIDSTANTVHARKGAVLSLYTAGGSIPNRGYFSLRHAQTNAAIGELDEEFVWEATLNQVFTLGTQAWRIKRITHDDVLVEPTQAVSGAPPFWRSEGINRSHHFSLRMGNLLAHFDSQLAQRGGATRMHNTLRDEFAFNEPASAQLIDYFQRQRDATQRPLPHRHHLLIEHVAAGPDGYQTPDQTHQLILHTHWGGRVNRPFALALAKAWESRWGDAPKVHIGNDVIAFQSLERVDGADVLALVDSTALDGWLRSALESSAFFGARFRECAGRALLLAPRRFNHRQPLWMTRQAAKDLHEAIADKADFPILLETWRTCLVDEFELGALRARLDEIADGVISWDECTTATPSPFASQIAFSQISPLMYADDQPQTNSRSALADGLIRAAVNDPALRPQLDPGIVAEFVQRRARTQAGWAPAESGELIDWVRERIWLTAEHWGELRTAVARDAGEAAASLLATAEQQLVWLMHSDGRRFVASTDAAAVIAQVAGDQIALHDMSTGERVPAAQLRRDDPRTATDLLGEALAFLGPHTRAALLRWSPLTLTQLEAALSALLTDGRLIEGRLVATTDNEASADAADAHAHISLCDSGNFAAMLRMQRAQRRATLVPLAIQRLPDFLANWQQFGRDVDAALHSLCGYRAPVALFESELLPARVVAYAPHQLDEVLREEHWQWLGTGAEEITFTNEHQCAHIAPSPTGPTLYFADPRARYDFHTLAEGQSAPASEFSTRFWQAVWGGRVNSTEFAPLREALARDFCLPDSRNVARDKSRQHARQRARGWPGTWRALPGSLATSAARADASMPVTPHGDAIVAIEQAKSRVRLLLARYGLLCRDLVAHEQAPFLWRDLFNALRLMELSGEVVAGHFFATLSAPQFAAPSALAQFARAPSSRIAWCSAVDPISPCGLPGQWQPALPRRALGNHLVWRGEEILLISEARGRRLQLTLPPDDPAITSCFAPLEALLARASGRMDRIEVETINGAPAGQSPYLPCLRKCFDVLIDHRIVTLRRRFS